MGGSEAKPNQSELPDELITEILTRLSAKSLHRFRCVSKHWNSQIKSTHFISSYISRHSDSQSWVILDRVIQTHESESSDSVTQFTLKLPPNVSTFSVDVSHLAFEPISERCLNVLGSSNGIFLFNVRVKRNPNERKPFFLNGRSHFDKRNYEDDLFVANPVTGEWVPLPKPPHAISRCGGIGFMSQIDSRTGVLERFLVSEYHGSDVATLMCYSSENGQWVTRDASCIDPIMEFNYEWGYHGGFEFEGHLLWCDTSYGMIVWDDPFGDLEKEGKVECRFIHIPLRPFTMKLGAKQRSIGVSGGHILFVELFEEGEGQGKWLNLYRLRDCQVEGLDFENWILTRRISWKNVFWMKEDFLGGNGNGNGNVMPMFSFFHPCDVDVLFFHVPGRIFSYNLRTHKVESCSDPLAGVVNHAFHLPYVMPSWPTSLRNVSDATSLKEQGNHHFKAKRYNEAIICYSRSIALSPNAFGYANRAMAYLKVKRHPEAEDDCTKALKLDGSYFKAYWRRATARKELGDLKGYAEDLESALKLQPDNQELENQYTEAKALFEKEVKLSEIVPTVSGVQDNPSNMQGPESSC